MVSSGTRVGSQTYGSNYEPRFMKTDQNEKLSGVERENNDKVWLEVEGLTESTGACNNSKQTAHWVNLLNTNILTLS